MEEFYVAVEYLAGDLFLQNYVQVLKCRDIDSLPTTSALWIIIQIEGTPDGKISRVKISLELENGPELRTLELYFGR